MVAGSSTQSCDDFFDFEFSAIGDELTLSVNGQPLLKAQDSSVVAGTEAVGAAGTGLFRDVALLIPTEASLVGDYRQLVGPFADPPKMDELFRSSLTKAG